MSLPANDYVQGGSGSGTSTGVAPEGGYWSLGKLKKSYQDYLGSKREEIDEQQNARRYYHAAQWTQAEIEALKKRKQPVVTFNRIGRKIDGVVGLLERLRQDPKAYPRTPQHEHDADLATAVIRYVLDEQDWKAKSPECARDGAVDGIAGIGLELEAGDQGDNEVGFEIVEPDTFFYDPRSFRMDFSDARFMGIAKWMDLEAAKEMFPDSAEALSQSSNNELTTNSDRDLKWFDSSGAIRRVRVVDEWYMHQGGWCYALYTGSTVLMEGQSFLHDEKGKPFCKYIMFSANVDQDGDRYGFVRNMKSAQDEINHRRSKGLHELNTRRLIAEVGAFDDIEVTRREAAKPDGVVLHNKGFEATFDDTAKMANLEGQFKFLENAYTELENFGPNPALIGEGIENKSGRAIQLLQQAGTAELGPYILAYRGWKIRVYRAIFNAVKEHWTAERFIRVTDDEDVQNFIPINQMSVGPDGMPATVNSMSALDVDIILDEGPDQVNMMMDAYDTLSVLASKGANIPPDVLIELSPLDSRTKKKLLEKLQAPNPAQQLQQAGMQAEVQETQASAELKQAQTIKTMAEAQALPAQIQADAMGNMMGGQPQQEYQLPPELQNMQAMAEIEDKQAGAQHKRAQAFKTQQDALLAPEQMRMDAMNADADRKLAAKQAQQRARAPA